MVAIFLPSAPPLSRAVGLGALQKPESLASQIRRYLSGVQRCPDRSASWHDRHPLVRIRPPGVGSRSPGWLSRWLPATRILALVPWCAPDDQGARMCGAGSLALVMGAGHREGS
jgi:hypothetical protein